MQKLDAGFCTYGFVSLLVPIGPKLVPDPNCYFLVTWKIFPVNRDKIVHKICLYFRKLDDFWQSYEALLPEDYKKAIKNSVSGATSSMKFPLNSYP